MSADGAPIPIMLVTGFLGAGKTTLIGQMLDNPAYASSALLVNEVARSESIRICSCARDLRHRNCWPMGACAA